MIRNIIFFLIINTLVYTNANANNLIISNESSSRGEIVEFNVSIIEAPNDVKSFGFDIEYPHNSISFHPDDYDIGELLEQGYGYLTLDEISPGRIRVGWFTMLNYKIPKHASGSLLKLRFSVLNCNDSTLKITTLLDHVETWPLKNGQLTLLDNSFCRMDFDNNNKLGLKEVIFLMEYLSEK